MIAGFIKEQYYRSGKSNMAKRQDLKEVGNSKEFMMSYVFKREALINLLDKKGIILREMSWEEIKGLRGKHPSAFKK